jgi:bacillithiol system protein YtxJ
MPPRAQTGAREEAAAVALDHQAPTLTTTAEVDEFLRRHPTCALFKYGSCHKNDVAFAAVESQLAEVEPLPLAVIRVVESRSASDHVAAVTGIRHESPQLILFREGRAVFDRDNWDISAESVAAGLAVLGRGVPAGAAAR